MKHARYQPVQRDYPILVALLVTSLTIAIVGKTEHSGFMTGMIDAAFLPFESLSARIMRLSYTYEENRILRGRLMEVARENMVLREQVHEIIRLRELLDFKYECPDSCIPARVLGDADQSDGGGIKIDKGARAGIGRDMVVISPDGLVGRVLDSEAWSSRVRRVTDVGSKISAMLLRSRSGGILRNKGGRLLMEWVPPDAEVMPGDTVISSGYGPVIPKGIPIGEVRAVHDRPTEFSLSLEVKPFVDFNRLEEVFVLKPDSVSARANTGD